MPIAKISRYNQSNPWNSIVSTEKGANRGKLLVEPGKICPDNHVSNAICDNTAANEKAANL